MSIASIFTDIESEVATFVQGEEAKASAWWTSFKPTLESDFTAFYNAVKPIAINLVVGIASAALSGPAKLGAVSAALLAAAEAQGISATKVEADTIVQQIVQSLGLAVGAKAPSA